MLWIEYMEDRPGESMSWCRMYVSADGDCNMCVYDGDVVSVSTPTMEAARWDGSLTDEVMEAFAREVNPDYDTYVNWEDAHIAMEAMMEVGCSDCPYRYQCEAMLSEMEV